MKKIKREIWLLIIILIIIIALELITNFIANRSIDSILGKLSELKENLQNVEKNEELTLSLENKNELELEEVDKEIDGIVEDIGNLKNDWFKEEKKLSFFAEHDELEKISYAITILEENAINNEYNNALENLVEAKYWLEHVKEKDSFRLKNIF